MEKAVFELCKVGTGAGAVACKKVVSARANACGQRNGSRGRIYDVLIAFTWKRSRTHEGISQICEPVACGENEAEQRGDKGRVDDALRGLYVH